VKLLYRAKVKPNEIKNENLRSKLDAYFKGQPTSIRNDAESYTITNSQPQTIHKMKRKRLPDPEEDIEPLEPVGKRLKNWAY